MSKDVKIIKIKNANGTTYIYEDKAYWDKELKQGRHKRVCIGKVDPKTNEYIYNKYYKMNNKMKKVSEKSLEISSTQLYGQKLVLEETIKDSSLMNILIKAFGKEDAKLIYAFAWYSLATRKPLYLADDWGYAHGYKDSELCSQRSSDLLKRITEDKKNTFFLHWLKKMGESHNVLMDITSISSYSRNNGYLEYGYNRDKEKLPQINLAYVSSSNNAIPLWYKELEGSMSDKSILSEIINTLNKLEYKNLCMLFDRGFYSNTNIKTLLDNKIHFTVPVPSLYSWTNEIIKENRKSISSPGNLIENKETQIIYATTKYYTHETYGRFWVHLYYDATRKERAIASFFERLNKEKEELETTDKCVKDTYAKFFKINNTPKKGRKVSYNDEVINEYVNSNLGYWILLSNKEKDAKEALRHYRERNDIETLFDDVKNVNDAKRLRVHSCDAMQGKTFIVFISVILRRLLRNQLEKTVGKDRRYMNVDLALSKLDTITITKFKGKYKPIVSTLTKNQRILLDAFNINTDNFKHSQEYISAESLS